MNTIAIVGLGYVGLPLLLAYARKGFNSIGFDIDPAKPETLLAGRSYIKHIPTTQVAEALAAGTLDATTDFSRIAEADAVTHRAQFIARRATGAAGFLHSLSLRRFLRTPLLLSIITS